MLSSTVYKCKGEAEPLLTIRKDKKTSYYKEGQENNEKICYTWQKIVTCSRLIKTCLNDFVLPMFCQQHLTIRLRARDFYEVIVDEDKA